MSSLPDGRRRGGSACLEAEVGDLHNSEGWIKSLPNYSAASHHYTWMFRIWNEQLENCGPFELNTYLWGKDCNTVSLWRHFMRGWKGNYLGPTVKTKRLNRQNQVLNVTGQVATHKDVIHTLTHGCLTQSYSSNHFQTKQESSQE